MLGANNTGLKLPTPTVHQLSFSFMADLIPISVKSELFQARYILNNLDKPNREIAAELNVTLYHLKHIMQKHKCCRTQKEVKELKSRLGKQLTGAANHNYRGGVSCDKMRYKKMYPDRTKARQAVYEALKKGKLIKGACEICGTVENIQAHHTSYLPEDQLKVNWLCLKDHKLIHKYLKLGLSYTEAKEKS